MREAGNGAEWESERQRFGKSVKWIQQTDNPTFNMSAFSCLFRAPLIASLLCFCSFPQLFPFYRSTQTLREVHDLIDEPPVPVLYGQRTLETRGPTPLVLGESMSGFAYHGMAMRLSPCLSGLGLRASLHNRIYRVCLCSNKRTVLAGCVVDGN